MTNRLWIMTVCGVLTWGVHARAQSLAPGYVNAETGLTLDEAISRAINHEPSLRALRTEVEAARGSSLQAGLRPNPTVTFTQQLEPGGTDSQSRVELQWPLDLFRRTGRVAVAEQELQATDRSVSDRERMLAGDVRMKYGEVVAAAGALAVSDDLVAATTRQYTLLRARVEQGGTPPLERDLVNVELRRLEAERLLQAAQADRALIELKRLLGMDAGAALQLRDSLDQLVERDRAELLPSGDTTIAARPDILEAEARVRVADARIDRAKREGRFDVSVYGMYMRMDAGFPQYGLAPQGVFTPIRGLFHYFGAGAAVTVPLRNQNQGAVASAEAERDGAAARLSAAQLSAQSEVAAARARDERARAAVDVYRGGARELARQNLGVVRQTYELGRATVFDVLNEQRRYLDFERAYTAALGEAYDARTALRRALGDVR